MKPMLILFALTASALFAAPAEAQWQSFGENCTPTGSLQTCASFEAMSSFNSSTGRYTLSIRVRNLWAIINEDGDKAGSILAQLGILSPDISGLDPQDELVQSDPDDPAQVQGDPGSKWDFHNSSNRLGDVSWALVAGDGTSADGNGGVYGCYDTSARDDYFRTCANDDITPAGWVRFSLTTSDEIDLNQLQIAWGVMAVDNNEDTSLQGSTCVLGECGQVVPEPMTIVLLGSGLIGVGAVTMRRRRRGEVVERP